MDPLFTRPVLFPSIQFTGEPCRIVGQDKKYNVQTGWLFVSPFAPHPEKVELFVKEPHAAGNYVLDANKSIKVKDNRIVMGDLSLVPEGLALSKMPDLKAVEGGKK